MSQGKGIRTGQQIPSGYIAVPTAPNAKCPTCKAEYLIVYHAYDIDLNLAKQHAAFLSDYLQRDHVDPNFKEHLNEYGPLDWSDSD
jgi:hypothetical protein